LRVGAEKSKCSKPSQDLILSFSSNGQPEIRLSSALDPNTTPNKLRPSNFLNPEKLDGIDE
jgi:hypothetical protein